MAERSGTAPPSPGGNPARIPLHIVRGLVLQKTSNGFFLETPIPYTSEASKKGNVKRIFGRRGCRSGSFHHSIMYSQQNELLRRLLGHVRPPWRFLRLAVVPSRQFVLSPKPPVPSRLVLVVLSSGNYP